MRRWLTLSILAGVGYAVWKRNHDELNATSIRNKVVIITGAAAGIGEALAHQFAREQAHLLLVDRDAQNLASVQEEVAQYGTRVLTLSLDVTDSDAPGEIVRFVVETFGRVDVLINNAGVVISGDMTLHSEEAIQRLFDTNVIALIRLSQAVVPIMRRQHSGHIINIASCAATMPSAGYVVYGASKGAVVTFSHALRREVARDSIRVSYIAPAWVQTQMIAHMHEDDMIAAGLLNPVLDANISQPHDVAEAALRAVRYNRYEIIVGGSSYHWLSLLQRLAPLWLDRVYARITDVDSLLATAYRPE